MKYYWTFLVALLPLCASAQLMLDKFEDMEEVSSVVVNQNMFALLAKIDVATDDPKAKEFMDMARSLKNLQMLITANPSIKADMKSSVDQYLKSENMEEIIRVKDKGSLAMFYTKPGKDDNHVSELLMWGTGLQRVEGASTGTETIVLSLTGDIDLRKISTLTQKMKLPKVLNQAQQTQK